MDTDVFAVRVAGVVGGSIYGSPARVRGLFFTGTGAGTIELRDGGATGPVKLLLDTVAGTGDIIIPAGGIRFSQSIWATTTGAFLSANIFLG
jgi:hypothetical protein